MKALKGVLNVREAKARFSEVLKAASKGSEFIITSNGEPQAKIIPLRSKGKALHVNLQKLLAMPRTPAHLNAEILIGDERTSRD